MTQETKTRVTREDALRRWPRVVAHLICESLGYFSPRSAAGAVAAAKNGEAYYCEWYGHEAGLRAKHGQDGASYEAVTQIALKSAIRRRHSHKGYMADYVSALALVRCCAQEGREPNFGLASWF